MSDPVAPQEVNLRSAAALAPRVVAAPTAPLRRGARQALALQTTVIDPVRQLVSATGLNMPSPLVNFDGISNNDNLTINGIMPVPPDNDGAVGPNHYVQWVNVSLEVFTKTGQHVLGPVPGNVFWSGMANPCATTNMGDPIVLYDKLAGRWLLSQFAFTLDVSGNPVAPFYQCIAVSKTSDPTGNYWVYSMLESTTVFHDYPKFGVWPDGYYMTSNEFDSVTLMPVGVGAWVFERPSMLNGQTARFVKFDITDPTLFGMLPSDFDGHTPPPAGAPNTIAGVDANTPRFKLFDFHVDWTNLAASTLSAPTLVNVAPYNLLVCGNAATTCIPQPGTAQGLDALNPGQLMFRLQYRNFGDHEALVTNHAVDADGTHHAGIRWYELRRMTGAWSLFQQGTYAPNADHRWMASSALDGSGNLAIGYSVSGPTTSPSIVYAGRLASDVLGVLGQGATTLMAGSGSQLSPSGRWGDYTSLTLDPTDDCTYWYTNEYYGATSQRTWSTRIGSFKFSTCGVSTATLSVSKAGSGSGTITSTPGGINCGATCSANFPVGTAVILNAVPAPGSTFAGWSGACSGSGSCAVTMSTAQSVNATFSQASPCIPRPPVGVSVSSVGPGLLSVTITASGAGNALQSLQFGLATNAVLTMAGQSLGTGNINVPLPAGTQQATFFVQRVAAGSDLAPLVVVDGCGSWSTFAGAGSAVS